MRNTKETRSRVAVVDDPFERLPEHILHHILALLRSNREAARTAVVSRSLHSAWSSYPIFDFHSRDFRPRGPACLHQPQTISDRFLDFVDKAMSRLREQRVAIPRFTLDAWDIEFNPSSALVDKWIGMALNSGAQKLRLVFDEYDPVGPYSVPARVFSSGYIKTMSLVGSGLIMPLDRIDAVNLSSLQSLELSSTPLDEPMLQKLLRGCPLLEELKLVCCQPLTQIVISDPNNLRKIDLSGPMDRIEIEAPSLEELSFSSGCSTLLTRVVLDHSPTLKHLTLKEFGIAQRRFQKLLSKFPLLESLEIGFCETLKKIMIPNCLLKKIEIEECEALMDIEIRSVNLSSFLYHAVEMQLPSIRMPNPTGISIGEAEFECTSMSSLGNNWFTRLRQFLTRSCQFESLFLRFDEFVEGEEYLLDTGEPLPSLPYNVEELRLSVHGSLPGHAALLNLLLSLLHPAFLRVTPYDCECDVLEYLCDKLENRGRDDDECCCCTASGHRKCWLHELKGVKIYFDNQGPLDWPALHEMLPGNGFDDAYFDFSWK